MTGPSDMAPCTATSAEQEIHVRRGCAAGEDLKQMRGQQPEGAVEQAPASPVARLLKTYFAFVQTVLADDPVMQLTFWRVRLSLACYQKQI